MDVTVDEYLSMIAGKTAALIGASLYIGALIGGAGLEMRSALAEFGRNLGLAFQIQDDILGIWGDEAVTGKSAASDILTRKKSLPVVYALADARVGETLQAIYAQPIDADGVPAVLDLLADAGAQPYAAAAAQSAHQHALEALDASGVLANENSAGQSLFDLAETLLNRTS